MSSNTPMPPTEQDQGLPPEPTEEGEVPEFQADQAGAPAEVEEEIDIADASVLDVPLKLSEDDEKSICSYLNESLPKMRSDDEEVRRIKSYLSMYDMAARKRNFPYENAPSLASTDAYDALNKELDVAETAFLQQRVTFALDREDSPLSEDQTRRVEKTVHRKFFLESGLASDLRLILFEALYLPGATVCVRPNYDIRPVRQKVVLKTEKDIEANRTSLKMEDINKATKLIAEGKIHVAEIEKLDIVNVGPKINRIDLTKFLYPRNTSSHTEWQIMGECEFYTASALRELAERGEMDSGAVSDVLASREEKRKKVISSKERGSRGLTEIPKPHILEPDWTSDYEAMKKMGDAYEDEFATYRVCMLYGLPTKSDPKGRLRSWIQVVFCPEGNRILGATFCQDGCPYFIIQRRPVSYRAYGVGLAQARHSTNAFDADMKSLFLASIEQEIGTPLMIRKSSGLWATNFRAYPGSVTYTEDVDRDAKFLSFPDKSRLAAEGMKMVLGTSPQSNRGMDYASGKREELVQEERLTGSKARIHSIAMDLDVVWNFAWKILCRLAKLNTEEKKFVPWVIKDGPDPVDKRLFVFEREMSPELKWSSVLSATTLTPDARLATFLRAKEICYDKVPAAVNSPRLTIGWIKRAFENMDGFSKSDQAELLPNEQDFQQFQAQLGAQGGQRPNAGEPPSDQPPSTPAVSQSASTPFRNALSRK